MTTVENFVNDNSLKIGDIIGDVTRAYNPRLKRICNGDIKAGLVLNQLHYWWKRCTGATRVFYKSVKELADELDLSEYAVRKSIKLLESLGYIQRKIKKLEHRTYYLVDEAAIRKAAECFDADKADKPKYRVFTGVLGRFCRGGKYDISRMTTCRSSGVVTCDNSGVTTCQHSGVATCDSSYKEEIYTKNYSENYSEIECHRDSEDFELVPDGEQSESNDDYADGAGVVYAPIGLHKKCGWCENWVMPDKYLDYAAAKGLVGTALNIEIEKFVNYWLSGDAKDSKKRNWEATWRRWVLKWLEYGAGRMGVNKRRNEWDCTNARYVEVKPNLRVYGVDVGGRRVFVSVLGATGEWNAPRWEEVGTSSSANELFMETVRLWNGADYGR
ncbi:winged helix-turn-helix domain-containing protein [Snodgrassella sp.]|uniref:winged helix-turn-helix domain-containing protein n=1 Tax=Snodgrassella sp. TaxID=2815304 RepID=UPI0025882955|nr:winged helix-turn-helix domain-containing protein [Snodgrassella sp.]MCO6517405.1 winged helix-turn-helix transcriptional regulator [Snodgrassella sp.]